MGALTGHVGRALAHYHAFSVVDPNHGSVSSSEPEPAVTFDEISRKIQRALADYALPSAAVAVATDGEIRWEEGFGWADRERGIPATPHTMYSLGSISKPIAATAVMILVERGLIDLDAPVNAYLGDGKLTARVGDANDATVRRLLNHTAGLPTHYHYFYEDEPYRPPAMAETIRRYGVLVTAPAERYNYANLGYGILGHVVERVSGKSYADFLRDEVFDPLGLARMSVWVRPEIEPRTAREYGGDNVRYPRKVTDHVAAGGIYASAHDLLRFGLFHLGHREAGHAPILTDAARRGMQVPTAWENPTTGYGIGWTIGMNTLGYRTVGHEGSSGGVSTHLLLFPTERVGVAVLTNSSRSNPYLPWDLVGDLAGSLLPPFAERVAEWRVRQTQQPADSETPPFTPPPELVGRWAGSIHTEDRDIPFALDLTEPGDIRACLADRELPVDEAVMKGSHLTGRIAGSLPTPDAARRAHYLALDLKLRGDVLNGAVLATAPTEQEGGTPERRLGFALGHWTELRRA